MILAVNVGHSSTAFGICRDSECLERWRIRTDRIDETKLWLNLDGLRLISERNPLR